MKDKNKKGMDEVQNRYKIYLFLAAIVSLATFALYIPALSNNFVNWDDDLYVYNNMHIRSLDSAFLKSLYTDSLHLWHPLTILSHAIDYALWGTNPLGHHLTNILLHSFNTFMIFYFALRLLQYHSGEKSEKSAIRKTHLITAFAAALLFGIHPIHAEPVAWVSGRKDLLCTFFYLLSLLTFFKYIDISSSRRHLLYALSLSSFILSLLSKPMAVSLPIVLLMLDFFPMKRISKKSIFEKLPFFIAAFLSSISTISAYQSGNSLKNIEVVSLVERFVIAIHGFVFYLVKLAIPLNLSADYPSPIKDGIFAPSMTGSFLLFLILVICSVVFLRRRRVYISLFLFYIVTLLPVSGILQYEGQAVADRYAYLPSITPLFLAAMAISHILNSYSKKWHLVAITVALSLLFLILSNQTLKQVAVWKNSATLWSHQIETFPDNSYIAYFNRGAAYKDSGRFKEAIEDFNSAEKLKDYDPALYNIRGNVYANLGYYKLAMKDFRRAIYIDSNYGDAYFNMGLILTQLGNIEPALASFERASNLGIGQATLFINKLMKDSGQNVL